MTKIRIFAATIIMGLALWGLLSLRIPQILNNNTASPTQINPVRNFHGVFRSPRELPQTVSHAAERRGIISNGINGRINELINTNPQITLPETKTTTSNLVDKLKSATITSPPTVAEPKTGNVPFTAQAPFGDWQDPRQQDGCEEASLIMAWHWLDGTTFTKSQALDEILALSAFEEKTIGEWRSTSAEDTAKIFREYYSYDNIAVQYDISAEDIKASLADGNLVLVPTDGRKLGNPYYRQPGPPEHMLVIFDYNKKTDEFITNDPGTRRGQNYRYKSDTVLKAIVDYPTGHREPNLNPRTAMIVIAPKP